MIHPTIKLFEEQAMLHDVYESRTSLDDAIVELASWMDRARDHLAEADMIILNTIGAVLYREGLRQRIVRRLSEGRKDA